ncbi:MAG: cysteine--tRNA ligase [candidate division Zixibacteria bacterium]|nr:cysteine--tRNA ligase [candidate division Zixibacteria bacterium]
MMALQFYNSLTNKKEDFKPIEEGKVGLYTCGPTVYDFAHIGNFRAYMFEDLLRRYLIYKGYQVNQVMNLTDIDDKTIKGSNAQGISLDEYTRPFKDGFFQDLDTLGIARAELYPEATTHIPEMIEIIKKLVANGLAYEIDGNYYFKISAFQGYGKLANVDMQGLKAGARVATDEYEKDSVSDFALWKAWDAEDGEVFWETELGKGRPGWHLECSAMSMKYLGEHFDMHTGGVDNKFPHHENEIAQSEGASGQKFVNYWLHCEHLIVDGQKMSKSLGNFYSLRDVLDKGYEPKAIRYLLISTQYRMPLNFTFEGLESASNALNRYNNFIRLLSDYSADGDGQAGEIIAGARKAFEAGLDDDLNISAALGAVFDYIRDINSLIASQNLSQTEKTIALEAMEGFESVLNFKREDAGVDNAEEIETLIEKRNAAKKNKDFQTADSIREQLTAMGIVIEDTPQGVKWRKKG